MRLPSLNMLKVFEAVARHQSMARAADELCVTHGAVSRQIRLLEEALGLKLFERRNRAVFLTHKGEELYLGCRKALEGLEETLTRLQANNGPQTLVLSCEPTLAMRWLIPRLPDFQLTHPHIALHLFTAGGPVDFARNRIDLALRRSDFPMHNLHAWPVAQEWTGPVYAPAWHTRWPHIQAKDLLHTRSRPEAWSNWQQSSGLVLDTSAPTRFEHFYLCLQAASAGLGVAISSLYMAADEICSGGLQAPCGFSEDGSTYCLLSPKPLEPGSASEQLLTWLREKMAATVREISSTATVH